MKRTIIFWTTYILLLILLYITSATDLIIKENIETSYPVAVLIDNISEENYKNIKKGLEDAAYEYRVDIKFPTLSSEMDIDTQVALINEEIELGVGGVIIGTKLKDGVARKIRATHPSIPIILLGESVASEMNNVLPDYNEMAELISENVAREVSTNKKIQIVKAKLEDNRLSAKISSLLSERGYEFEILESNEKNFEKLFENEIPVIIGSDKESSSEILKYMEENNKKSEFYAIGSTNYLLQKLDTGDVRGMVTFNEYEMGYVMIKRLLENRGTVHEYKLEVFYLQAKDLKNERYMRILYPI